MARPMRNPFQPGPGLSPPLRAGHERAAAFLADRLERIRSKEIGNIVILCGPRGNGKTVLLGELCEKAARRRGRVIELDTSDMAGDSVTLADLLEAETAAGPLGAGARAAPGRPPKISAGNALRGRLDKPLLLVIDEAHEMPVAFGRSLLLAAQRCIKQGLPLLVVLAGTPGLPAHLRRMRVGFMGRCRRLRIGRLETAGAAREALAAPAKKSGMPIDEDALALLVEESQRYPFYVQQLGHESWQAAHDRGGARQITLEDAQDGVALAQEEQRLFHSDRRREAGEQGVLGEAEAVSRMVVSKGRDALLTTAELVDAVEGAAVPNGRDPGESWERLEHLGLVWEASEPDCWEPGIPSLCRHIVDKVGVPVPKRPG